MRLKKEDIEKITDVGSLFGDTVKLLKTWGGLHVLVGKKSKHSRDVDTLTAASHKALALFQLEKEYGDDFKPVLMKSEHEQLPEIHEYPFLKDENLELISMSKGQKVDFVIAKNVILATYECEILKNELHLKKYTKSKNVDLLKSKSEEIRESVKNALNKFALDKQVAVLWDKK
jgi:hypothetical protein